MIKKCVKQSAKTNEACDEWALKLVKIEKLQQTRYYVSIRLSNMKILDKKNQPVTSKQQSVIVNKKSNNKTTKNKTKQNKTTQNENSNYASSQQCFILNGKIKLI